MRDDGQTTRCPHQNGRRVHQPLTIKLDEFLSRLPTGKPYHTDGLWGRDRDGNEYFGVTAECDGLTAVKPDAYMHRCEIEEIFIPDALLEQGLFLNIPW